jgi:hypothetical protein
MEADEWLKQLSEGLDTLTLRICRSAIVFYGILHEPQKGVVLTVARYVPIAAISSYRLKGSGLLEILD